MRRILRSSLMVGVLAALHVWGGNNTLFAGGPESLPSINSSPMIVAAMPEQTLTVTCYLGNPNDKQSLGSITVNSPEAGGANCNSLNYACQGRCFGCYADFDLAEDVCVDSAGRKYIR